MKLEEWGHHWSEWLYGEGGGANEMEWLGLEGGALMKWMWLEGVQGVDKVKWLGLGEYTDEVDLTRRSWGTDDVESLEGVGHKNRNYFFRFVNK